MLLYWFYPNPGSTGYENGKILALAIIALVLFGSSFAVAAMRKHTQDPIKKRLSRSWPSLLRWLSATAFLFVIARAEGVQFLSMRFLWLLWGVALVASLAFHIYRFRLKHYTIIPKSMREDPLKQYLPKAKPACRQGRRD